MRFGCGFASLVIFGVQTLQSQSLRTFSKKTLFLISLATAKRVSELQALSHVVPRLGDDLILSFLPFFVAKMGVPILSPSAVFSVAFVEGFAHRLEEGSLLCPVRALSVCLQRTKGLTGRSSSLFVSPRCPSRAISKNALSFFLREVIQDSGAVLPSAGPVWAHSIRGMATSVSFLRNWAVSKVLEAATWKSKSVFGSFYLNDISYVFEGLRSLGRSVISLQWGRSLPLGGSISFFVVRVPCLWHAPFILYPVIGSNSCTSSVLVRSCEGIPSPATRSPFGTSGLLVVFNGDWFMPQRLGSFLVERLEDIFRCRFGIIYFIRSPCSSTIGAGHGRPQKKMQWGGGMIWSSLWGRGLRRGGIPPPLFREKKIVSRSA